MPTCTGIRSLVGLFQQGEGGDRGVCAGEVILCRIVGVRAGSLSQYHITEVNVVGNAAGSADAENPVYVILVEQLIGIDADGGHAHAAALYGNRYAVIGAGVAVHAADGIVAYRIFQKMFCDEFRPQRVAGHEYGFGNVAFGGCVMRGCHKNQSFHI